MSDKTLGASYSEPENSHYEYVLVRTLVARQSISSYIKDLIARDFVKEIHDEGIRVEMEEVLREVLREMGMSPRDPFEGWEPNMPSPPLMSEWDEWWKGPGILTGLASSIESGPLNLTVEDRKGLLLRRLKDHWLTLE